MLGFRSGLATFKTSIHCPGSLTPHCCQLRVRWAAGVIEHRVLCFVHLHLTIIQAGSDSSWLIDSPFRRDQARSKRSRFVTLVHTATKSFTNFSFESAHA